MANVLLPILAGNLPTSYCFPASPQQLLNDFAAAMNAVLPGGMAYYNYGDTAPAVAYQGYPWLYTNTMRWYQFSGGLWISPHPYPASGGARIMFTTGTLSDIWDFDGGDGTDPAASPPNTYTGAMWEVDADFTGRSPMGPGAISGSVGPKTLLEQENYGTGAHALTTGEGTLHYHGTGADAGNDAVWMKYTSGVPCTAFNGTYFDQFYNTLVRTFNTGNASAFTITTEMLGETTAGTAHQTVHPVRGIYIIKRTARAYYTAP